MIKFYCPHCHQKIGLPESYAGKQVRCAKCRQPMIVPLVSTSIEPSGKQPIIFQCNSCGQKLRVSQNHAGKKVKCPQCQAPLEVPGLRKEEPPKIPADNTFGEEMLEPSGGQSDMLSGLAAMEQTAQAVGDKPLRLAPQEKGKDVTVCYSCGSVNEHGSSICSVCGTNVQLTPGTVDTGQSGRGRGERIDNLGVAALAGLGFTIVAAIFWCVIAKITGYELGVLVLGACYAAGAGFYYFTSRDGVGVGLLAILIAFVGLMTGKVLLAKYVLMPMMMPEMRQAMNEGIEEAQSEHLDDEAIAECLSNPQIMFACTLLQLAEDGEFEQDFAMEIVKSNLWREETQDPQIEAEAAEKRVYECLAQWDRQKKERVVRAQYPKYLSEIMNTMMDSGLASAVGFVAAFIASFGLLDLLWFPLGFVGAYKLATKSE